MLNIVRNKFLIFIFTVKHCLGVGVFDRLNNPSVGHLNSILARVEGNLNHNFKKKGQMPRQGAEGSVRDDVLCRVKFEVVLDPLAAKAVGGLLGHTPSCLKSIACTRAADSARGPTALSSWPR